MVFLKGQASHPFSSQPPRPLPVVWVKPGRDLGGLRTALPDTPASRGHCSVTPPSREPTGAWMPLQRDGPWSLGALQPRGRRMCDSTRVKRVWPSRTAKPSSTLASQEGTVLQGCGQHLGLSLCGGQAIGRGHTAADRAPALGWGDAGGPWSLRQTPRRASQALKQRLWGS